MKQFNWLSVGVCVTLVIIGLTLWANPNLVTAAEATFPCVADANLEKHVAPEAELVELACFFKKYEGAEVLHFKVGIKNSSDKPQRFRVNIFLENGKAAGGLIPQKTKKGLVGPGKTANFVYPVTGMTAKPKGIMVKISTISE